MRFGAGWFGFSFTCEKGLAEPFKLLVDTGAKPEEENLSCELRCSKANRR